jgi:TonB family protein
MLCLWPSASGNAVECSTTLHSRWKAHPISGRVLIIFFLLISSAALGWSSVTIALRVNPRRTSVHAPDRLPRHMPAHVAEFTPMSSPLAVPKCERVRPPEALLTPDPLVPAEEDSFLVRVSFVVGTDGHVHSAFVLHSGGADEDAVVLRAVRTWRYRPAMCNGVPTDSEARVRFSIQ